MLPVEYYEPLYYIVVSVILIFVANKYQYCDFNAFNTRSSNPFIPLLIALLLSLFIGLRPIDLEFVDMGAYNDVYMRGWGYPFQFTWDTNNKIFDNILAYMSSRCIPAEFFFLLCALINFLCSFFACAKLFPKDTLFAYLTYLIAFGTYSGSTNGLKAGCAASIFLLAFAFRDKKVITILLTLVSIGFHHSMILVAVAYLCTSIYNKKIKYYFYLWFVCVLISALHITFFQELFANFADEQGQTYLRPDGQGYITGFRLDFILFSAVPVIQGYNIIVKKNIIVTKDYRILLCLYTFINSIWMLCMYASYTNRIAGLSWLLYSTLLILPYTQEFRDGNQLVYMKKFGLYVAMFTLVMYFVYPYIKL